MKILGKLWSGITWAAGKVWSGIKWVGSKLWGAAKGVVGFVRKQPAWKVALVGLAGVAAVVIASKLSKGGNDMDLFGENRGGNGIATAAKIVGGTVAVGAGAELAYRGVKGVLDKNKSSGSTPAGGSTPTVVTTGTPTSTPTVVTTGTPTGKAPTSPATYTIAESSSTATVGSDIEPVSDLDLDINSSEIQQLEAELDAYEASKVQAPGGAGFANAMSKVGAN